MKTKFITMIVMCLAVTPVICSQEISSLPIECLSPEQDGSLTVLVTGSGRNMNDAREQALKNAVSAILFDGIRNNNSGYTSKPLLLEVNARERYQDYFNIFFTDGGEFTKYASKEDMRIFSREKQRGRHEVHVRFAVRVLVPQLKEKLVTDGIIKVK